ncbi:C4b-binding protein beta chain [Galemys pyrenaicus]|uniref:C4b-binding protein beta chain n=1 Tax=Galemys pyrenaicus TaxID=202257 RepID=A0A8J6A366_GALPY|nr:C4b-binding protein beta chain [Galemys pyrenaicus]
MSPASRCPASPQRRTGPESRSLGPAPAAGPMLPRPVWVLAALWLLAAADACPAPAVHCPEPAPVDYSILVVEEAEGRLVVTFLCVSGYHLVGEKTLLCDGTGRWSAPAPTCRAGHCPDPAPENGESSPPGPAHVNDTVTFLCAEGLVLRGSGWSQCREDHAWRPPPPICHSGECTRPPVPPASSPSQLARLLQGRCRESASRCLEVFTWKIRKTEPPRRAGRV